MAQESFCFCGCSRRNELPPLGSTQLGPEHATSLWTRTQRFAHFWPQRFAHFWLANQGVAAFNIFELRRRLAHELAQTQWVARSTNLFGRALSKWDSRLLTWIGDGTCHYSVLSHQVAQYIAYSCPSPFFTQGLRRATAKTAAAFCYDHDPKMSRATMTQTC